MYTSGIYQIICKTLMLVRTCGMYRSGLAYTPFSDEPIGQRRRRRCRQVRCRKRQLPIRVSKGAIGSRPMRRMRDFETPCRTAGMIQWAVPIIGHKRVETTTSWSHYESLNIIFPLFISMLMIYVCTIDVATNIFT